MTKSISILTHEGTPEARISLPMGDGNTPAVWRIPLSQQALAALGVQTTAALEALRLAEQRRDGPRDWSGEALMTVTLTCTASDEKEADEKLNEMADQWASEHACDFSEMGEIWEEGA